MKPAEVADLLEIKFRQFNKIDFIEHDPVSIPHRFSKKEDIEIAGFFAAVLAWGQRKTIIDKCGDLFNRMDNAPFDFILHHSDEDLKKLLGYKHRTFNDTDLLYFVWALQYIYKERGGLEQIFSEALGQRSEHIGEALIHFKNTFFSLPDAPKRTEKHIASPKSNSACKRLNMFLRWMVRGDNAGVDFGLWHKIAPAQLICPCDVHVVRTAQILGLTKSEKPNWKMAVEITENLRAFDREDPTKYDFALFGLGIEKFFG
ncbi:TIGR02757 family protein [Marinilongibacter aquaticus]|uniref:TIGR02757 family protein n=1 Tax=Marinilongibacter aquaticus TaxID=2975157 RepID=UPI0021BD17BE|nr:TIGR02757 family protein [Marinilongibacter aquaticus]UBM59320.1 TIGR02757 family protein [Marinilongibacter aquaticus]